MTACSLLPSDFQVGDGVTLDASSPSSLSSRRMETSSGAPSLGGVLHLDWEARRLLLPARLSPSPRLPVRQTPRSVLTVTRDKVTCFTAGGVGPVGR